MSLPHNFSWFIPNRIAAGGMPGMNAPLENDLSTLWDIGVRAILTLREEPLRIYALDDTRRFEFHHEPLPDHSIPDSFKPIDCAIDFIRSMFDSGAPVFVHCLAGIGRTGMVLAAFVAVMEKLSGQEALRFVEMKRGPLDTFSQQQFLLSYVQIKNMPDTPHR